MTDTDKVEIARQRRIILDEFERLCLEQIGPGSAGDARLLAQFGKIVDGKVVYADPRRCGTVSPAEAVAELRRTRGDPEPEPEAADPAAPRLPPEAPAADRWSALEAADDAERKRRMAAKAAAAPPARRERFRDEMTADELNRRAEAEEAAAVAAKRAARDGT